STSTRWTVEETRAKTTTLPAVAAEPGASAKTRPTARRAGTGSFPSPTHCYEPPGYAVTGSMPRRPADTFKFIIDY
ncbi:MAG: hypothetical protein ACYCUD_11575, partial [Candidatus Dormibacteria bacterium]